MRLHELQRENDKLHKQHDLYDGAISGTDLHDLTQKVDELSQSQKKMGTNMCESFLEMLESFQVISRRMKDEQEETLQSLNVGELETDNEEEQQKLGDLRQHTKRVVTESNVAQTASALHYIDIVSALFKGRAQKSGISPDKMEMTQTLLKSLLADEETDGSLLGWYKYLEIVWVGDDDTELSEQVKNLFSTRLRVYERVNDIWGFNAVPVPGQGDAGGGEAMEQAGKEVEEGEEEDEQLQNREGSGETDEPDEASRPEPGKPERTSQNSGDEEHAIEESDDMAVEEMEGQVRQPPKPKTSFELRVGRHRPWRGF